MGGTLLILHKDLNEGMVFFFAARSSVETCNHPCQLIVGCYLIFELVTTWWTKEMFRAERKNSNDHDDSFTRIINSNREHDFFFSFLFFY